MNTNKMAKLLGNGKWLVAFALVGCGGGAQPDDATSTVAGAPSVSGTGGLDAASGGSAGAVVVAGSGGALGVAGTGFAAGAAGFAAAGSSGAAGSAQGGSAGEPEGGSPSAGATLGGAAGSDGQGIAGSGGGADQASAGMGGSAAAGAASGGSSGTAGSAGAAACECTTGQCCDGCNFQPNTYQVGLGVFQMGCAVASTRLITDYRYLNCTGASATAVAWGAFPDDTTVAEKNVLCSNACWDPCMNYTAFGLTAPFCAGQPYYPAGVPLPAAVPACL
ncbi:MAG TPA: hypothetical protein VK745_12145 [Polyangiaceae bacterium]|jgi:hypothetical protein|nr:hypothetical protein [Polyangiaceae bacterium]